MLPPQTESATQAARQRCLQTAWSLSSLPFDALHSLLELCRGGGRRKTTLSQITLEQLEKEGLFDLPIQVAVPIWGGLHRLSPCSTGGPPSEAGAVSMLWAMCVRNKGPRQLMWLCPLHHKLIMSTPLQL